MTSAFVLQSRDFKKQPSHLTEILHCVIYVSPSGEQQYKINITEFTEATNAKH